MAYAVGPRADDAWRILAAIVEAKVPDHEAKREMTWMGRENDLNVVIAQMQEWLQSKHLLHGYSSWTEAVKFIIGGKVLAFFDEAFHSSMQCIQVLYGFRHGVSMQCIQVLYGCRHVQNGCERYLRA